MRTTASQRPLFIHGAVDDYGLTPAQFRVLCAIARRGECFERVALLAKRCGMHRNTVWQALKDLEACKIIGRTSRPGRTTVFRVNPLAKWCPPASSHVAANRSRRSDAANTQPEGSADTQPETSATEVTPTKLLPLRRSRDYSQGF